MTAVIEVRGLTKRYGGRRVQAVVDGISFHVDKGEIFGILGPNGAGKTTAVECLVGLRKRDDGQVRILGLDPRTDGHRLHQRIGVQLQETQLQDKLKVREALELYASFYPDPADWRELLERWGLTGKSDTSFAKLSGGQKQRLFIALALVGNPEVVFLDELTAGLDPGARRATWDLISQVRAQGVTVVLVSHFMDEAVLSPSVATRLLGQVRQPAREPLSQRELDILGLVARGCSNREAAARLFISEATVKTHLLHIYAKLGVNDRAAAVATGFERGLLPRP